MAARYGELRKRGITAQEAAKTAGSSDGPSQRCILWTKYMQLTEVEPHFAS